MAELMLVNPRKRRRRKTATRKRTTTRRRRRNPVAANPTRRRRRVVTRRRRRRNPNGRFNINRFLRESVTPAAMGAGGALGLDMMLAYVPLPAALNTPAVRPIVRIAGAIGIGMVANMFATRKTAEQVSAGALTVVLYDTIKGFLAQTMPQLRLGEYVTGDGSLEFVNPALNVGDYEAIPDVSPAHEDMSVYTNGEMDTVGVYVPN